jgi:hypothetical protein
LLKVRDHVQIVCEELNWDCLSNSEWNLISRIEKLLEPFASYTQLVSADLMPTLSSAIPCVEELKFHLIEVRLWHLAYVLVSIFTAGLKEISELLLEEMRRHFDCMLNDHQPNFDPIFLLSMALDPNFKVLVTPEHKQILRSRLIDIMDQMVNSNLLFAMDIFQI